MVFIPRAQPSAQSLFLFPIVFGINLIHFFDEKKDGAAGNSIVQQQSSSSSSNRFIEHDVSTRKLGNVVFNKTIAGRRRTLLLNVKPARMSVKIRLFVSVLRTPVTPFDSANFAKSANCFEECNVFGNGKCELDQSQSS